MESLTIDRGSVDELRNISEYLAQISPHSSNKFNYIGMALSFYGATAQTDIDKATNPSTPTKFSISDTTFRDRPFEVRAITGWAHENTTPADVNLFTFNILDNSRNIKWFDTEVWASQILTSATDPYILPSPYLIQPNTLLIVEGSNYNSVAINAVQIVLHGYTIKQ